MSYLILIFPIDIVLSPSAYCWTFAKECCEIQPLLSSLGVEGPVFISIGDEAKLNKFLEINPTVPSDSVLVDGYDLQAYDAAGFEALEFGKKLPEGFSLKPPDLGFRGWWKYLTNVGGVSPMPSDTVSDQQVLGAVSKLGGTFLVNGDNVFWQHNDVVPGDTPSLDDVLDAFKAL